MKAWVLHRHGAPERSLELREVPDPVPGAGQVLIRSEGFGLNYADVMAVKGLYREAPPPPCVLGYETVGRVERCGAGVPADLLGKRVTAICRFGGHAELVVTDPSALAVIPDDLELGVALALATQGCTAWYMARMAIGLRKGQRVLVHSAAGGVGQLLVQLALQSGCEVFAIASGAKKRELLLRSGATHVIDRSRNQTYAELGRLLNGHRIDVSFNAVGGSTFKQDLRLLAPAGVLVLFGGAERGAASGPFGTLRFVWNMGLVVPILLMMKSQSLIGVNMLRVAEQRPDQLVECLAATVEACRGGVLRPQVHRTFAASELPQAIAELGSGSTAGKVALRW